LLKFIFFGILFLLSLRDYRSNYYKIGSKAGDGLGTSRVSDRSPVVIVLILSLFLVFNSQLGTGFELLIGIRFDSDFNHHCRE